MPRGQESPCAGLVDLVPADSWLQGPGRWDWLEMTCQQGIVPAVLSVGAGTLHNVPLFGGGDGAGHAGLMIAMHGYGEMRF